MHGARNIGYLFQLLAVAGWTSWLWLPQFKLPALIMMGADDPIVPVVNGRILADEGLNKLTVLFDDNIGGRARKLLGLANRNGFYYVLDRETGQFLNATPYAKQTWADGIDANGAATTSPTVMPGDMIFTGTPGGVGMAMNPPRYLKAGDVVKLWVENIGEIENRMA